ncbi:hypothetical protein BDW74DRAFT_32811 [Aspergillus multicolor]|uniref:uncharacterized protein n=1 Tax=Aspergillus multicolor TaxID=41759 RepID=UPI003CCD5B0F
MAGDASQPSEFIQVSLPGHDAVLSWLTSDSEAAYQARQQYLEGLNFEWFLKSDYYQVWLEEKSRTLFCPGGPGTGDSTLTAVLVDDLRSRFPHDPTVAVAYLSCKYEPGKEYPVAELLASLLSQFAVQGPYSLPLELRERYQSVHVHGIAAHPTVKEIGSGLAHIVSDFARAFILVDSLDALHEFDNCQEHFLSEMFCLQSETRANLL